MNARRLSGLDDARVAGFFSKREMFWATVPSKSDTSCGYSPGIDLLVAIPLIDMRSIQAYIPLNRLPDADKSAGQRRFPGARRAEHSQTHPGS